jgi:hypothetical protein
MTGSSTVNAVGSSIYNISCLDGETSLLYVAMFASPQKKRALQAQNKGVF